MSHGIQAGLSPLERARREAARYGSDDWIFVRELLQNARDAGARRVEWRIERGDGLERVICRDDGEGMTLEHGRAYLFTLYASSKRDSTGSAGRFGIGFWSVLRFAPSRVVVRSRSAGAQGWSAELSGSFDRVQITVTDIQPGTEVVLERPDTGADLEQRLEAAIREDAPYLRRRDGTGRTVETLLAGRPIGSRLELPPPSIRFAQPGLEGAVGLGPTPEVRLYAHGLRVRTAAHLDELLAREPEREPAADLEGLMPRLLLDSDRVEVVMARGDARENRELTRLVATGRAELQRFLRHELDRVAPRGPGRRLADWWRRGPGGWSRRRRMLIWGGVVLGVALGLVGWQPWATTAATGAARARPTAQGEGAPDPLLRRYAGLGEYPGPAVAPGASAHRVDLRYRPASARPYLAALRVSGREVFDPPPVADPGPLIEDRGPVCPEGCLELELEVAAPPGLLRLLEPSGGRIDPRSVTLDGRPMTLWRTARDEPVVVLHDGASGVLSYRARHPWSAVPAGRGVDEWPAPPGALAAVAEAVAGRPAAERPRAVAEALATRLRYDRSPEVAEALRAAPGRSASPLERVLEAGGGDCDVLAAVAGSMLAATGLPVRLAVGWIGRDGRAAGGLHAWLEVEVEGAWHVLDPSAEVPAAPDGSGPPAPPVSEGEAAPSATTAGSHPRGPLGLLWSAATLLAAVAALGGLASWRRDRRVERRRVGEAGVEVAELLRGVLQRPELFPGVGDLEARALAPVLGGGRVSLRRARRLAERGELSGGRRGGAIAERVAALGGTVLDLDRAAGRAVAERLGAHDLEAWESRSGRVRREAVSSAVESALRRIGCHMTVLLVDDLGAPGVVMRGAAARVVAGRDLVAFDDAGEAVTSALDRPPALAAVALADETADLLDLGELERRTMLAALATAAVVGGGVEG